MNHVMEQITEERVVIIMRRMMEKQVMRVARILTDVGFRVFEITFDSEEPAETIKRLKRELGAGVLVGAGTVVSTSQVDQAIDGGADFVVTPHLSLEVITHCRTSDVPIMSGALTPTEIFSAWTAGVDCVKVFPAAPVGGPSYIRALKGPYQNIPLLPTGGIRADDAASYIDAGSVAVGMGSSLFGGPSVEDATIITRAKALALALPRR